MNRESGLGIVPALGPAMTLPALALGGPGGTPVFINRGHFRKTHGTHEILPAREDPIG